MNVAIYTRVSRDDLHTANQIAELEEYAKKEGWQYEIFEEVESSRNTRPIKEALKARLWRKEFDGLLIWKLDRWARSTSELVVEAEQLFIGRSVRFISLRENIDLSSSSGRFYFAILAAFAELERNIISERTKAGQARARREGKRIGRPRKAPPENRGVENVEPIK